MSVKILRWNLPNILLGWANHNLALIGRLTTTYQADNPKKVILISFRSCLTRMMYPVISIYAELLYNIRQVSVATTLAFPSASLIGTTAEVRKGGRKLRVTLHDGTSRELTLPAAVKAPRLLPVNPHSQGDTFCELSWRFPLLEPDNPDNAVGSTNSPVGGEHDAAPWSAIDLVPSCALQCRECGHVLVPEGRIHAGWRDLPSENWAEMMEFWHCHKPPREDGQQDPDHLASSRGYGANTVISAQEGVGFVDLTSFLISESDCSGVVVSFFLNFSLCCDQYLFAGI